MKMVTWSILLTVCQTLLVAFTASYIRLKLNQILLPSIPSLHIFLIFPLQTQWTLEELTLAMKLTPRGRTPGLDGLPIEFYAAFWDLLCAPLLEVFEFALSSDSPLPYSSLISGIILLFKKGDPKCLSN